jgi:hypothetical protein
MTPIDEWKVERARLTEGVQYTDPATRETRSSSADGHQGIPNLGILQAQRTDGEAVVSLSLGQQTRSLATVQQLG